MLLLGCMQVEPKKIENRQTQINFDSISNISSKTIGVKVLFFLWFFLKA